MGDWAEERAKKWLEARGGHPSWIRQETPLVAALLREVDEQSIGIRDNVYRREAMEFKQRADTLLADVRRVVEGVRATFDGSGPVLACNEILARLGKL